MPIFFIGSLVAMFLLYRHAKRKQSEAGATVMADLGYGEELPGYSVALPVKAHVLGERGGDVLGVGKK